MGPERIALWQFDFVLRLTDTQDAGGRTTFTYNAMRGLTKLVNAEVERTTFTYDVLDRVVQKRMANGTWTSLTYDLGAYLTRVWNRTSANAVLTAFTYTYDNVGTRLIAEEPGSVRNTWTYDNAYQVASERRNGTHTFAITYTYDAAGNRTKLKSGAATITTSVYDAANRLTYSQDGGGRTTFTFDANGNQRVMRTPSGDRTTFSWTYENQLKLVEQPDGSVVTYTWAPVTKTADEFRVETETDAGVTRHFWDRHNVVWETDDIGTLEAEYTYDPQPYGNLVSQRQAGESSFYHFDNIGSTRKLTDDTQTVTDSYLFRAFGDPVTSTGTTTNPYQWLGEIGYYRDTETGLYNLRRREYQAGTARFASEDPQGYVVGDENLYQYVANNPVTLADPSGLDPDGLRPAGRYPWGGVMCARGCHQRAGGAPDGDISLDLDRLLPKSHQPDPNNANGAANANAAPPPELDLSKIPAERVEALLNQPETTAEKFQCGPPELENVVVAPIILEGVLVQGVFVENMKFAGDVFCDPYRMPSPLRSESTGTYRLAATGLVHYSKRQLAENYCESDAEAADYGRAQLLTAILHTLPGGTLADYCAHGADSGVGEGELIFVSVSDLALGAGLLLKTTTTAGRAVVSGPNAVRLARGVSLMNQGASLGFIGLDLYDAIQDKDTAGIATAAAFATATLFGRNANRASLDLRAIGGKGKKRGPKPKGFGPHNLTILRRITELIKELGPDWEHVAGGYLPEQVILTPGGVKSARRPDITFRNIKTGEFYHENVGKTYSGGGPVKREIDALDDLERQLGYDRVTLHTTGKQAYHGSYFCIL